jgi:hypothetical protein
MDENLETMFDDQKTTNNDSNLDKMILQDLYHIMILIYFRVGSTSSGSAFVIAPNLGAKTLSEYFTGNAPPLYILDPLL